MAEPLVEFFRGKGQQCLEGAASEFDAKRYDNCANRAYYACFHMALAALMEAGIIFASATTRWSHEFVQAQFAGELINRRKRYPTGLRSTLADTQAARRLADYGRHGVPQREAARVLRLARQFVASVAGGTS